MPTTTTLSPEKQALLAQRLKGAKGSREASDNIRPRVNRDWAPLSNAQRQMWLIDQMMPGNSAYNLPNAYRVTGPLDVAALEASLNEVIRRHEVLRTTFALRDGEPVQQIHAELRLAVDVTPLDHLPDAERDATLHRLASEDSVRAFDLTSLPLIRARVFRLGDTDHVLLINAHHIVADGLSIGLLLGEVDAFYGEFMGGAKARLPDVPVQYGDYAAWQRATPMDESVYVERIAYWRKRLSDLPLLELPSEKPRPAVQSFEGSNVFFRIPAELTRALTSVGAREQCTSYMTLLAAFQLLLQRYTGADDLVIGSPVAARAPRTVESLIGNFLRLAAIRCDLGGDPPFAELLRRTRDTTLDALTNCVVPFDTLLTHLSVARDSSRNPVFQVMLQVSPSSAPRLDNLDVTPFRFDLGFAQFDLSLHLYEEAGGYAGRFEYCTALLTAETAQRMCDNFMYLLHEIVEHPDRRIASFAAIAPAERRRVMAEWNDTRADFATNALVHESFEAQADRAPERTAVKSGSQSLTYAELDARANRIAHVLRARGAHRGTRVGVHVERGADMVAAVIGVLKTGAAYVPLDPSFPAARLQFMVSDAHVSLLVCTGALADSVGVPREDQIRLVDDADVVSAAPSTRLAPGDGAALAGDPAYLIYTSGSTGTPKGVVVPHRAVVNFLASMARQPGLGPDDVLVAVTTLSFDISVLELQLPLAIGGTAIIATRDEAVDGAALAALLERHDASVLQATPTTWRLLLDAGWTGRPHFKALIGGEALPPDLAARILALGVDVWNMYGPTETTVWSTCARITDTAHGISIGRPIANTIVRILDAHRSVCPVGVGGELYIGGAGLALGYWRRAELTAERFIADPFDESPGALLYRTGDRARWRADGTIEHLGRLDRQLKVRGLRIEPGEVESVLLGHPAITRAVVDARSAAGEPRLVAYVVLRNGAQLTASEARRFLRGDLPDYMVPGIVMRIAELPMTANGKVDRAALPDPFESVRSIREFERPRTPAEEMVAEVWRELLHVARVGREANFFELGGHSLLALRAVHELEVRTGVHIDPRRFFFQTLARIAASLTERPAAAG